MRALPRASEIIPAIGRVLLWSFPLLFAGSNPLHGYELDLKLLFEGPWIVVAIAGLVRTPRRDARIFYGVWLSGLLFLEAWHLAVPSLAASF